jgi:transposase
MRCGCCPRPTVKPFVRRNKTDARDAAAICHAMRQPDLHPVPLKTVQQSCARGLERAHDLLVRQRTQLANAIRGLLAELGIVAAQGLRGFATLCDKIDIGGAAIPELLRPALRAMLAQGQAAGEHVAALQAQIMARARADATMRRLMQVPGIGPLTAHAIVAAIGDGRQFGAARDFAAWAGLTPHQHESGGKRRSGRISRQGDNGVRRLLVLGASAVMRQVRAKPRRGTAWIHGILARRPVKVAVVAQAAKTARIAWAMLRSGEPCRAPAAV